ncbi:enediyne biosynthesis protein [Actinoplanes sp. ATCC 53533]|uniref:DUF1702 family protein n=1 Tax=Actinoplanes sp. ATCC 53533 TaxID=1288362 RepID=UPI000F783741|nr:DUF1702 family protein [Actinoplanes sp. ATCC 53533]RSM47502.1 enediyne biosynthesis protein [Actinoplanes sp. ATCC 53533]
MSKSLRALRRRLLTPNVSETRADVRGFHVKNESAREVLETVGRSFLEGFGVAAEARRPESAGPVLDRLPQRYRGFAFEGAAMALGVRDGLPFGRSDHVRRFLDGPGDPHVYMAYVGIGWAMARLPRWRWNRLAMPDPLLRWLVLDGYGFHQAYFRTAEYVGGRREDRDLTWPGGGPRWYMQRAIDQGIGRALWFVCGTDVERVANTIAGFPEDRRADLWSGAGLAATYAGGADDDELRLLQRRSGGYRDRLAQGSAFGATARVRADLVVPHCEAAVRVLCAMTAAEAAEMTGQWRPARPDSGQLPAYEVWRQRIADQFAAIERK